MKPLIWCTLTLFLLVLLCCKKDDRDKGKTTACSGLVNDPIEEKDSCFIAIPNAFTPNGDGRNDWPVVFYKNIKTAKLVFYDNDGNVLFQTNDLSQQWTIAPSTVLAGTYFYRIEAMSNTNKRIGICGELYAMQCVPRNSGNKYYFQTQFNGKTFDTSISPFEYQCP